MKNVTAGRLGGFIRGLFKSSSWRETPQEPSSWSAWRPAGFQDLVFDKKRNTTDAGLKHSSMTLCDERHSGFTLIELLVVVLIIGILAAVALPQYQFAVYKARYVRVMPFVHEMVKAQEIYYLANGSYALDLNDLDFSYPASCTYTKRVGGYDILSCPDATMHISRDYKNITAYVTGCPLNRYACASYFVPYAHASDKVVTCDPYPSSGESVKAFGRKLCLSLGGKRYNSWREAYAL